MIVLHVPHSSFVIPEDLRSSLTLSDVALMDELLVSTDWFTDELFDLSPADAISVRFPVSRLVLDPERYVDAGVEPLEALGRGVVYMKTAAGQALRVDLTSGQRDALIDRFYRPHHRDLREAVDRALAAAGHCLLVDCHSFPSEPLPCDLDQAAGRPDICLGTDPAHTPEWLLGAAVDRFEVAGLSVAVDHPYAGVVVPEAHVGVSSVVALMVELNRRLYMDEHTGQRNSGFDATRTLVRSVLCSLGESVRQRM